MENVTILVQSLYKGEGKRREPTLVNTWNNFLHQFQRLQQYLPAPVDTLDENPPGPCRPTAAPPVPLEELKEAKAELEWEDPPGPVPLEAMNTAPGRVPFTTVTLWPLAPRPPAPP